MPVKKISDAPANIRELDGAKLTLAQVNYILRIYDGLKDGGEVESPMAVAIAQFKKAYRKVGSKWVKKGEGASMVDLEHLERYIVIRTGERDPGEVEDLRELEGEFGNGVYPLWSDGEQSIVAFAFEPALFKEAEAQAWVRQAMEKPKDVSAVVVDVMRAVVEPLARAFAAVVGRKEAPAEPEPVVLHAFSVRLGDGEEADEDDGLVWKELIHPGKWFKSDSGRVVEITAEMIKGVFEAWKAGLPKLVSVPSDGHHDQRGGIVPVESNRGFVEKLKLIGDRLFGGFKFTDPEVSYGVGVGNIADVSVYLNPDAVHPDTGEQYPWILEHVLLTNAPLVQDLEPFGAAPVGADASGGRFLVQVYEQFREEVNEMGDEDRGLQEEQPVAMSAEDQALLREFKGLGLSVAEVQTMAAERAGVRAKARGLEVTRVVRALEGLEEHDLVTQVEGTRHYPVVCAAVEQALREQPEPLALRADDEGRTGLDAAVLAVVNAIPQEGRMVLTAQGAQPAGSKDPPDPSLEENEEPTEEQIEELGTRIL